VDREDTTLGRVRRIEPHEVDAWCACPLRPDDPDLDSWRNGEADWIRHRHPTTRYLYVFDAGADLLGKYDVPERGPNRWMLWAPSVREGRDDEAVMAALCRHIREQAERCGVGFVEVTVEAAHADPALARRCLAAVGFDLQEEKVVYYRKLEDALPPHYGEGLEIRPAGEMKIEALADLCRAAGLEERDVRDRVPEAHGNQPGLVAFRDGEPIGVALSVSSPDDGVLLLLHFGLVGNARGQGIGRRFLLEVLRAAREAGYEEYTGSTAARNLGMIALFRELGCEQIMRRWNYAWEAGWPGQRQ